MPIAETAIIRMKDTLLLIDANSLIHRAYHALPTFTSPTGEPTGALYGVSSILIKVLREGIVGNGAPRYIAAAFDTPEPTFRKQEYKEYKGTRGPADPELVSQLIEAKNLLTLFGIKSFGFAGWEADDVVATFSQKFITEESLGKICILSGDLDMLQAVRGDKVVVMSPQKGISSTVIYDEAAVQARFGLPSSLLADYKGLVGDKSDNIPGVQGIGPKTAVALLNKFGSLENIYKEIDEVGLPELKVQDKLSLGRDKGVLSKKLATLRFDLPLVVSLRDLDRGELNTKKISKEFKELGFNSLIERVSGL